MLPRLWRGESTSAIAALGKALDYLAEILLLRKVYHRPFRDVAGLKVFLVPHVPLAIVLTDECQASDINKDKGRTVDSVLDSPKAIPGGWSLRAGICMGRVLISAFNPDLGRLPAHSALAQVSLSSKEERARNVPVRPRWLGIDHGVSLSPFATPCSCFLDRGLSCTSAD